GQYERRRASTQAGNWPRDVPDDTTDSPSGSVFPVGTNEINPGDGSGAQPESVDQDFWAPLGKKIQDAWNTYTSSFQRLWNKPDELLDEKLPDSFGGSIIDGTHNRANGDDDWEWKNRGKPLLINAKTDDKKKVFRDVSGDLKVFCTKCILEGSVLATVAVAKRNNKITASTLTINPSNFKSKGQLSVQRDGTNHAEAVNDKLPGDMKVSDDLDIIGSAVPDYGISMGDWGDLGFTWAYQFGFGIGLNGIVDLGVGWEAGIKGNALLTIDLLGDNHRLVGEELLHYSHLAFVIRKLSGQCNVKGHGQATISFGLKIKAVKLEARVFMPLPEYQIGLKPSKGGTLCPSSNSVHSNLASLFLVKGGICEEKGIDTGVITEHGAVYNLGGGDHTVGDEPITPNFGGDPVALDCIGVPLGVFSEEGAKPLPGTTVPGKLPPPKPAAGKKEEDKQQTPCDGKNGVGETCPTSDVQTEDQVALSNDFPTNTLSSDGSIASLQSAALPDFPKPNDPNTPSLENSADSGHTNFRSANDNAVSLQPGPLAASLTYNTASLQPGPLADVLSSADNAAQPVDRSASLASSFALPSSSLTDPTSNFQPQDSSHFLASANLDLTAVLA
ncbi:hypothetical protein MMC29_007420, partial [Sticta canariensis]|nr:hypothetical protein [Sticta canariensis]